MQNIISDSVDDFQLEILEIFKEKFQDSSVSLQNAIRIHQLLKGNIEQPVDWKSKDSAAFSFSSFLTSLEVN